MLKKAVVIKDVARLSGVSITTVSHVLNGNPKARITEATRDKVLLVARELNYRPNFTSRTLVTGKCCTVGLLQQSHSVLNYNFFQSITRGMAEEMEKEDYYLLSLFRSDDYRYLNPILQKRVDGVFVLQRDLDESHIRQVVSTGIPLVVVNKSFPADSEKLVGCVHSDHEDLAVNVIDAFTSAGCKRILCINDSRHCDANVRLADAFQRVTEGSARHQGLTLASMIPSYANFSQQVRNMLTSGQQWDGIYVDGLEKGRVLVEQARSCGLQPGREIHFVVSEVDEPDDFVGDGMLAYFAQQPRLVGRQAWNVLRAFIQGEKNVAAKRLVPFKRLK